MRKRVLSILLSAAMVLSLLPTAVLAESVSASETNPYSDRITVEDVDVTDHLVTVKVSYKGENQMAAIRVYYTADGEAKSAAAMAEQTDADGNRQRDRDNITGWNRDCTVYTVDVPESVSTFTVTGVTVEGCTTWNYDESSNTLTLNADGELPTFAIVKTMTNGKDDNIDLTSSETIFAAPWGAHRTEVEHAVVTGTATTLSGQIFKKHTALQSVDLSGCTNMTAIGNNVFEKCLKLTSVTLPNDVTTIGQSAFNGCAALTTFDLHAVRTIGKGAFANCASLSSMTLNNGLETIGAQAFYGDAALTGITIPGTVQSVGDQAFMNCTGLASLTIENGVTAIEGKEVFQGCTALTAVVIPDSVTAIGKGAFYGCTNLATFVLGSGVKEITDNTYKFAGSVGSSGTATITSVIYASNAAQVGGILNSATAIWADRTIVVNTDGGTVDVTGTPDVTTGLLTPVNGIKTFDGWYNGDTELTGAAEVSGSGKISYTAQWSDAAMNGNCGESGHEADVQWALTENATGYTLTISGDGAMADYYVPTTTSISGKDVEPIDGMVAPWYAALADEADDSKCVPITNIVVGENVTKIGNWAFAYTQIEEASFAANVKEYGVRIYSKCAKLTTVDWTNFKPEKVWLDEEDAEAYTGAAVPGNMFDQVSTLRNSKLDGVEYADRLVLPADVTAVGTSGFYGTSFVTVDFKNDLSGVKQIGYYSFAGMKNLTELTIPANLTFVTKAREDGNSNYREYQGSYAFATDTALKSVVFEEGFEKIPGSLFPNCSGLETLVLPGSLTSIGHKSFDQNISLHSIDLTKCTDPVAMEESFNCYQNKNTKLPVITDCTFYLSDASVIDNSEFGGIRYEHAVYAVTNGGTFAEGTVFEAGKLSQPKKTGYDFNGWFTEDGTKVTDNDTLTAGATYYAKWEQMYGDCGEIGHESEVQWALTENAAGTYTLTITGNANMADFTQPTLPDADGASIAPWYAALADEADANGAVPITEVVVEDGVTGLGNWAFAYTQVKTATFTESVKNYGVRIYSNCPELTTVNWAGFAAEKAYLTIDDTEPYVGCAIPGNLFDQDRKLNTCIVDGKTYVDTLVIPDTVKAVGNGSLYATAFTEIDFATGLKGVEQVGYYTFAYMPNLVKLSVPAGLTYKTGKGVTTSHTFSEEKNENFKLTLADDITEITNGEFSYSSGLTTLTLPSAVKSIGARAFDTLNRLYAVDMTKVADTVTLGDLVFKTVSNKNTVVNALCTFYTSTSALAENVKANNGNDLEGNIRMNFAVYAVTNGGTFANESVFKSGKLAQPEKTGYIFKGWFTEDGTEVTDNDTLTAGTTYYAKWVLAEPGDLKPDFSAYTVRVEHTDRTGRMEYALDTEGGIIDEKLTKSYGEYSYDVTIDPAVFIALYNADVTDGNHVETSGSTSMTFSWKWEDGAWKPRVSGTTLATVKVAHELPVYLYFQTINNRTGSDVAVDLTEADLARAGLTYEPDMHNGYHNYAKLISNAALPMVAGTKYTAKDEAPFSDVLAELADGTNVTLHKDCANFQLADQIVWTDLLYNLSSHNGWNAVWSAAYHMDGTLRVWNVAFDANGGTGLPADIDGYYVNTAALTLPELTRTGYTFSGWKLYTENTDGTYTETDTVYGTDTEKLPVTGNWKFVAQWTANSYTVTFNANGGEGTMEKQSFTYDEAQNLTANAFTRAGYNFTGWNTEADGSGTAYADGKEVQNLTAENGGNVNLYAQWEIRVPVGSAELVENLPVGTYGEAYTGSVTANKTFTDEDCVKLVLLDAEGNVLNTTDIGSGLTYVNGAVSGTPTAAGTVTFTVALLNVENQIVCQKTCTITINKAQGSGSVTIADWTYGETASKPVPVSATNGTDHVTYFYKVKDAADSTYTTDVPTAAGEYTVKAVFAATDNYLECSATADFTIRKAVIASIDLDVNAPEAGGKPQQTVADGEHYTASISWSPADDPFDFNTAYTATVTLTPENGNYTFDGTEVPAGWEASYDEETGVLTLTKTFPKTDMDTVKTPVITPNGGLVTGGTAVRITCETEGAVIHYTTDGSTPTKNSPVYTGELYVYMTMTLKAIAVKDEFYDSAVASAEFSVYIPVDPVSGCTLTFNTNGGSAIPGVTAPAGTKISLTGYVPTKTGYTFDGWYLDGALTQPVTEVVLTSSVTVYAKWAEDAQAKLPFTDVKTGDWFYEGVDYVWANGLMNGVSADTFAPYANTTRGMIVTILARMEGVNTAGTPWYAVGREWAMANGVSDGTNMEGEITREQLAAMLYRYANLKGYDVSATVELISFADGDQVSDWAEEAMKWAVANGLIKGRSDTLAPKDKATRGEVATVLMRFRETIGK